MPTTPVSTPTTMVSTHRLKVVLVDDVHHRFRFVYWSWACFVRQTSFSSTVKFSDSGTVFHDASRWRRRTPGLIDSSCRRSR